MTTFQSSLNILIRELRADDELRDAFLRDPQGTLRLADEWALPLCDSEVRSLQRPEYRLWETVVDELVSQSQAA
jgi:hypothetical protein